MNIVILSLVLLLEFVIFVCALRVISEIIQAKEAIKEGFREEIKNGVNTKENELPTPRGHKEVCPHPANKVFLLNGWYRCEECNGKWKSKIK